MAKSKSIGRVREHELGINAVDSRVLGRGFDKTRAYMRSSSKESGFNEVAIDSIIDPDMDTELLAEAEERANKLDKAMAALPDDYREVLELFYYEDKTTKEIAEDLGLTVNAVTTRLSRARTLLEENW